MNKFYITTSWDDGVVEDLRLSELLTKYNISATFYVPINNLERKVISKAQIKSLSKHFEIGGHTYSHANLTKLSIKEAQNEIINGKKELENIISKTVTSFAYPYGAYNDQVKQLVGLSGFSYARTVNILSTSIDDKLASGTSIHAYSHNPLINVRNSMRLLNPFKLKYTFSKWENSARDLLNKCEANGGVFHLWGHSWEIEETNSWKELELLLKYIRSTYSNANFVTNGKLIDSLQSDKYEYYSSIDPAKFESSYQTSYYKKETKFIANLTKDFDKSKLEIADIGCGVGRIATLFHRAQYTGFDNASNLIGYAKKKKKGSFRTQSIDELIDSKHRWDLIILWGLLEDSSDPITPVVQLLRLLNNKGRLIFTLSNSHNQLFKISKRLRAEYMDNPFPTTSFDQSYVSKRLIGQLGKGYTLQTVSFGVIPPMIKGIPAINWGSLGVSQVFVIDKIKFIQKRI